MLALVLLAPFDWAAYGRDAGGARFVPDCAITRANVARLRPAWNFHTGDLSDGEGKPFSAFECTPILADGTLLVVTPFSRVFALDPDTGKRRWVYDPKIVKNRPASVIAFAARGVSTWKDPKTGRTRVLLATFDARLIALDLATGKPIPSFGRAGTIDLRTGVVQNRASLCCTSPPLIVGSTVVVGSCIADDFAAEMPAGTVRAFDVRTGRAAWTWRPVRGGAGNAWAPLSADPARGLVFVPTGSQSPDFYGGSRPGNDENADSVTCLRAATGRPVWSFQTVHHDLWNYDVPAQPILTDVKGKPAAVVLTKMGHVFVLDRLTGRPILPVEERRVPPSDVSGEKASPTQPFPTIRLDPDRFVPWGRDEASRAKMAARVKPYRAEGMFTPPSAEGTLIFPGGIGGANWSGGSVDPITGTLFVNTNRMAFVAALLPRAEFERAKAARVGGLSAQRGVPYGVRQIWLMGPGSTPGNAPPWGVLHAVDLATGKERWDVPLGVHPALRGRSEAKAWGSPNLGGSFVTNTGLVFIAAAMDGVLRAFDARDGSVLWSAPLPAGGNAAPMSYRSPKTGATFVVQCAGGHHGLGSPEGDSVVAFRLE